MIEPENILKTENEGKFNTIDFTRERVQYFTNIVLSTLHAQNGGTGVSTLDLPFLVAALRFVANEYAKTVPGADAVADELMKNFSAVSVFVKTQGKQEK